MVGKDRLKSIDWIAPGSGRPMSIHAR